MRTFAKCSFVYCFQNCSFYLLFIIYLYLISFVEYYIFFCIMLHLILFLQLIFFFLNKIEWQHYFSQQNQCSLLIGIKIIWCKCALHLLRKIRDGDRILISMSFIFFLSSLKNMKLGRQKTGLHLCHLAPFIHVYILV